MFQFDTILNIVSNLTFVVLNLVFWYFITDMGFFIEGWTYNDILVFVAFSEFFFGMDGAVFQLASRFWWIIYSGALDSQLTRPIDPRLRLILLNMNHMGAVNAFLTLIFLLVVSQAKLQIGLVLLGVVVTIFANITIALVRFVCSYAGFWLGKMDAISELLDSMSWFNKYPMTILPKAIKVVFKTVLPFYFFSTFSTEVVLGKLNVTTFCYGVAGLLCNLGLWSLINWAVWEKGIARYEGING